MSVPSPLSNPSCVFAAAALALAASAHAAPITLDRDAERDAAPTTNTPHTEPITAPASSARHLGVAPSVMASALVPRAASTIASLSLASASPDVQVIADAAGSSDGDTNFRGEKVVAAPVRFFEDFESGQVGPEWTSFGGTLAGDALTTFANPAAPGGLVLNVKTESDSAYEIRLDIYLMPPAQTGDDRESSDNILSVFVDDQTVMQLSPESLRKLSGKRTPSGVAGGQPLVRTIRVPFTAAHAIAELRFEATSPSDSAAPSWGIDNLIIDLGLQDPVFGITGGGGAYEPGSDGLLDPGAGLTGEIPPLPKSRYGSNEPFAGDAPSSSDGSPPTRPDPVDDDRNEDSIDDDIEDAVEEEADNEIPSPPTTLLVVAAVVAAFQRRRAVTAH